MKELAVLARRSGKYWELYIDDIGVTQSRNLESDADLMIRSYVAMITDAPKERVAYTIRAEISPDIDAEVVAARVAARDAEKAGTRASVLARKVCHLLVNSGLTGRDTAVILGVSPQRVSQLLR